MDPSGPLGRGGVADRDVGCAARNGWRPDLKVLEVLEIYLMLFLEDPNLHLTEKLHIEERI